MSAFPGGERDAWEAALFGGAYHAPGVRPGERPKYGALDLMRHADGPAPRFGSCYLVLKLRVADRCTFTLGDSHRPTGHVGVRNGLQGVVLGLLRAVSVERWDLGVPGLTVPGLLRRLRDDLAGPLPEPASRAPGRIFDHYVEAQVHGPIHLARDADTLVADPSFRGTPTGQMLEAACVRHDVALRWHAGFVLPVRSVCDAFRGPAMPHLARRIAGDGTLDAAVIGRAAASFRRDPGAWRDWATPAETSQHLKQLWHVVLHCGAPAPSPLQR